VDAGAEEAFVPVGHLGVPGGVDEDEGTGRVLRQAVQDRRPVERRGVGKAGWGHSRGLFPVHPHGPAGRAGAKQAEGRRLPVEIVHLTEQGRPDGAHPGEVDVEGRGDRWGGGRGNRIRRQCGGSVHERVENRSGQKRRATERSDPLF
jgi:hypothetical protein